MSLDVTIDRSKEDVTSAIYEFAARRGLAATTPWYLDGIRIEDTRAAAAETPPTPAGGFWGSLTGFFTPPAPGPVISIELSRRKKKTRVVMALGAHRDSVSLAQALRTYLQDDRAYDVQTPLTCSRCSAQIVHFIARFCGRCGLPLGGSVPEIALPPAIGERAPLPQSWEPALLPQRVAPVALPLPSRQPAVSVEREVIVTREASAEVSPPEPSQPAAEEPGSGAEDELKSGEAPIAAPKQADPEPKRERTPLAEPATEVD